MDPTLLALLIQNVGVPELTHWLLSRNGAPLTDADVKAKLATDTKFGQDIAEAWLAAHPKP